MSPLVNRLFDSFNKTDSKQLFTKLIISIAQDGKFSMNFEYPSKEDSDEEESE